MITNKEKPCKGTGKAKGYGCKKPTLYRKYGLCQTCLREWAITDEKGKDWLKTQTAYKMKKREKEQKAEDRAKKEKQKLDLMSPDKYRAAYVQPVINKIARQIDFGNPCIATGNFEGKMAGGHYTSVGSNRTICLNLHNIFIQSFHSNNWKGGDNLRYRDRMIDVFGQEYLDYVEGLRRHRPIKLTKDELIDIRKKALEISRNLSKSNYRRTAKERVELRNKVNVELGIYDPEFLTFQWVGN